ncbi:MAG: hypothetical protein KA250_13150 [Verrucomicrobiales bacterium]|jgi:hypothetical protein|nr:hypothetical protein [Verrucomicrobiales bacterium]MBP9225597.1 hypothetical protein [Verrucomicrobiales bacterium]HQZ27403.1 hypothetical protein [Verrucomicrobiales bacterium]
MRTTLSLDDDLAKSIENFRKRKNLSLREVVNQLLREGLQATSNEHPSRPPYSGPVFHSALKSGIDPNRMNQLADDLEAEEFVR